MSDLTVLQDYWLQLLTERLEEAVLQAEGDGDLEGLNCAYLNFLAESDKSLAELDFTPREIRPGDWPLVDPYNHNFIESKRVVEMIFRWLKGLGDSELALHNFLLSQYLGLKTQIQRLAGTVADLELFQKDTAAGVRVYGDTFTTADKTNTTGKRDWPVANLDLQLGAVTLPLGATVYQPQVSTVKLNPFSNGVPGNNQQLNVAASYNDMTVLTDGRLDTWFEYEVVSTGLSSKPLVLDFTITFVKETLLNRLRLYLNNLGSTTWPRLHDVQVSLDGKNFLSLKAEIEAAFPSPSPFEVEPIATKTGGLMLFLFQPRRVRHLRLIFQQTGYYFINTTNGQRYRYAIGIREIIASGITYQKVGEYISQPYLFPYQVQRAMLEAEERVAPSSEICKIQHYLSPDQGETWQELQSVNGLDATLSKVLSFEDQNITSLTYRAVLSRQEGAEAERALSQSVVEAADFLSFPTSPPYALALNQVPEADSLSLSLPYAGSAGMDTKLCLGVSDGAASQFFVAPFILDGDEEIWVNKQLWQQVDNFTGQAETAQVYTVNYVTNTITFGNGVNGLIPVAGFKIYLALPPERLLVQGGEVLAATLKHYTIPNQSEVKIYRVDQAKTVNQELLARGATILRLAHQYLVPDSTLTFTGSYLTPFAEQKTFVDGNVELILPGDYSVDYRRGIVYTKLATPVNSNCFATYQYTPREALADTDWAFSKDSQDTLEISPDAFRSEEVSQEDLGDQAGSYRITLANSHLIYGRIAFSSNAEMTRELQFIDGVAEFAGITFQQDESVPAGVTGFTLEHIPRQDYQVIFSDVVVFAREVSTMEEVDEAGTYWVDYTTGDVFTYLPTAGGQVNYYYHHDLADLDQSFSVDYEQGEVHTYNPLPEDVTISYQYCYYEVEYYLAEIIPSTSYIIRAEDKQVEITDIVLINNLRQRFSAEDVIAVRYRYLVQESPSAGALQMLTPVLHSYGIRLLFKESV